MLVFVLSSRLLVLGVCVVYFGLGMFIYFCSVDVVVCVVFVVMYMFDVRFC